MEVSAKIPSHEHQILLLLRPTNYWVHFLVEESGVFNTCFHIQYARLGHKDFPL